MIQIDLKYAERTGLTLKGHAGFAAAGSDIVCAACTTLAYAVANGIQAMWQDGVLEEQPKIRMEPGNCLLEWQVAEGYEERQTIFLAAIAETYDLLARSYPEHVQFHEYAGG